MKTIRLGVLGAVLLCGVPRSPAEEALPPAAQELLQQFEDELARHDQQFEVEIQKARDKTTVELKPLLDRFCKEVRLEEAVAVRDLIRGFQAGKTTVPVNDLPPEAREVHRRYEVMVAAIRKNSDAEVKARYDRIVVELTKLQDRFTREAKLDEAVAVRELTRSIRYGLTNALPDPGYVESVSEEIRMAFYYQVTGVGPGSGHSICGTDIYTTGSHLGMAAVHCGLLKVGQRGIVKVTILPGQDIYTGTTRNGVTSYGYGKFSVSFKIERVYGFIGKRP
jgi:hypothetical protein